MSYKMKGSPFKRAGGPGDGGKNKKKKQLQKASINAARQLLKQDGINDPNLTDAQVRAASKEKGSWGEASSRAKQAMKKGATNYDYEDSASPLKKQKLSKEAAARKKKRDLAYAKTPARRAKKADAQARRRKAGAKAKGKDWDHKDGRWETPKENRGNGGKGTKSEGGKKYYVKKRRKK